MMKYPRLAPLVSLKKVNNSLFIAQDDEHDERYAFREPLGSFANSLNGKTNPFSIGDLDPEDVCIMLETLNDLKLLRWGRVYKTSPLKIYITLGTIHTKAICKKLCAILNVIMLFLWGPIFVGGLALVTRFTPCMIEYSAGEMILEAVFGMVIGYVVGLVIHEVAHACAAFAYNGCCEEFGLLIRFFVFVCAYTLIKQDKVLTPAKRLQISAAGIEANFLLSGFFFGLCTILTPISLLLFCAGVANLSCGLYNLLLFPGVDGFDIFKEFVAHIRRKNGKSSLYKPGIKMTVLSIIVSALQIVMNYMIIDHMFSMAL